MQHLQISKYRFNRLYPNAIHGLGFVATLSLSLPAHSHGIHFDAQELNEVSVSDDIEAIHALGGVTSSQGVLGPQRLAGQSFARSSDVLETVPGLNVTQHSGGGKANQYFLRGFSLDHGTDLSIKFLGAPLNLPGHAHGQGYTDSNMVIPELLSRVEYRKGPYFAQDGDFSSAGALNLDYVSEVKRGLASLTVGEYGYFRTLLVDSGRFNDDQTTVLYALELSRNNGPWEVAENNRKSNVVLKVNHRLGGQDRLEIQYSGYESQWVATDHIPEEAVKQGVVGRFGSLDPSAGGMTKRHALSAGLNFVGDQSITEFNAYVADYSLNLFSDFTYGLRDNTPFGLPGVLSDQFNQADSRTTFGGGVNHTLFENLSFVRSQLVVGADYRLDAVDRVGLYDTVARARVATRSEDNFQQSNWGVFVSQQIQPVQWMKLTGGVRYDLFRVDLNGQFDDDNDLMTPNVSRSGVRDAGLVSPKLSASFKPFGETTELFVAYGRGFHSNDPRGLFTSSPVNYLARTRGGEFGVKFINPAKTFNASATVFQLQSDSELVFVGDAGTTEPKGASRRNGLELVASYLDRKGLQLDGFFAVVDARFIGVQDQGIPNAIRQSGALSLSQAIGDFKLGYKLRYLGSAPLVEDRSLRSDSVINSDAFLNYRVNKDLNVTLSVFNLFDRENSDIQYAQDYAIAGTPGFGRTFHPAVPRQARLTVNLQF